MVIRNIFVSLAVLVIMAKHAEMVLDRSQRSIEACGVPKAAIGLIVRGKSFPRGSFPWIVALMYTRLNPPRFFCAGTLISKTFVVSCKLITFLMSTP